MKIFDMKGCTPSPEELATNELAYNIAEDTLSLKITSREVINILKPKTLQHTGVKNIIIDGELLVNQSGFDGTSWVDGAYGYDLWKATAVGMVQIIEEHSFDVGEIYTLSGEGIVTEQLLSPLSGNWTIEVPRTARRIQLERGSVATAFERIPYGEQLARVQRYYVNYGSLWFRTYCQSNDFSKRAVYQTLGTPMRTNPTMTYANHGIIDDNASISETSKTVWGLRIVNQQADIEAFIYDVVLDARFL